MRDGPRKPCCGPFADLPPAEPNTDVKSCSMLDCARSEFAGIVIMNTTVTIETRTSPNPRSLWPSDKRRPGVKLGFRSKMRTIRGDTPGSRDEKVQRKSAHSLGVLINWAAMRKDTSRTGPVRLATSRGHDGNRGMGRGSSSAWRLHQGNM